MATYQVKRKLSVKEEEIEQVVEQADNSSIKKNMRYVHLNPRAFKGRLGYAYVLKKLNDKKKVLKPVKKAA
jgi:hypothetical protein